MKNKVKNLKGKIYTLGATVALATVPTSAFAAGGPSTYVNSISDGLYGEILSIAPKVLLVVLAWALLMYFTSGDEHKKSKHKNFAFIAIVGYLGLIVLKPLVDWIQGLI